MRGGWLYALAMLTALAPPSAAQQVESQALSITATNVTAEAAGRDAANDAVRPGDVLEYRLAFTNVNPEAVENVVFTDPIPEGLALVPGSAGADRPDVRVEFSIDGGATWSARPMVRVQEGGEVVERPAPESEYTHVRWTVTDAVAPGATVTARFRAAAAGTTSGDD